MMTSMLLILQFAYDSTELTTLLDPIEATLHCMIFIQEAIPVENSPYLKRLFGPDILGKLPTTRQDRVRHTALGIIGNYPALGFIMSIHLCISE
jgi:hypothetical protein